MSTNHTGRKGKDSGLEINMIALSCGRKVKENNKAKSFSNFTLNNYKIFLFLVLIELF